MGPVLAPVELERLARLEHQRHECPAIGGLLRALPVSFPGPHKGCDPLIRAVIAKLNQISVHLLGGAPVLARLALLGHQPACQLLCIRVQLARSRRCLEPGFNDPRPQILLDGVARQPGPPRNPADGHLVPQSPTSNDAQKSHVDPSDNPRRTPSGERFHMGQISVTIPTAAGSVLGDIQQATLPGAVFVADADSVDAATKAARSCSGRVFDPRPHKDVNAALLQDGTSALWERLRRAPKADLPEQQPAQTEHLADDLWAAEALPVLDNATSIKRWLPRQGLAVLFGPSNVGKTFLGLDMAAHVAASKPWHGHRVDGGLVIFLAYEGGSGIRNRVHLLARKLGDIPLRIVRADFVLCDETGVERLLDLLQELSAQRGPVRQIWVDTLAPAMGGQDENSPEGMGRALRGIARLRDATGALVVAIHHTGKDESRGARGHSSLRAAADTEIIKAEATKQRDLEKGAVFRYKLKMIALGLDKDGEPVTTCRVQAVSDDEIAEIERTKSDDLSQKQRQTLTDLANFISDHGQPNPSGTGFPDPGRVRTVDVEEFVKFAAGRGISTAKRDRDRSKTIREMIAALVNAGRAQTNVGRIWLLPK